MTTSPSRTSPFNVFMHPDLVNQLDESLSPIDGLVAIDQVFLGLPRLHANPLFQRHAPRSLKAHYAVLDWCGIGLTYVQVGRELHVLDLWSDDDRQRRKKARIVITSGMFPDLVPQAVARGKEDDA